MLGCSAKRRLRRVDFPAPEGPDITIGRYFWLAVVVLAGVYSSLSELDLRVGAIVGELRVRWSVERYRGATVGADNKTCGFTRRKSIRCCCGFGGLCYSWELRRQNR